MNMLNFVVLRLLCLFEACESGFSNLKFDSLRTECRENHFFLTDGISDGNSVRRNPLNSGMSRLWER